MAAPASKHRKKVPKILKRPFAIMRLFHEAARISFKDVAAALSTLQNEPSLKNAEALESTFSDLQKAVAIHKAHEDKALYPALSASIHTRLAEKNYTPSLELLVNGLTEIPSFSEEHKEDHEAVNKLSSLIHDLKVAVSEQDQENAVSIMERVSDLLPKWLSFHEEHLQHEEGVMSPLMKGIATTLHMKVAIARTLLMVNRQETITFQFPYTLDKLLRLQDWFCPMTQHKYVGNEILAVYINCFKMMIRNEREYQIIVDKAKTVLNEEQWNEMQQYGLDSVN